MDIINVEKIEKFKRCEYKIDEWNVDPLADLFYYFTGNIEECEKRGNSLKKGIMLCGGIGSGKTKIMQAYKRYTGDFLRFNSFQYIRAAEIVESAKVDQTEYLRKFGIENQITCYIDDIAAGNERAKTYRDWETDRKSTRLNSSHEIPSRMPSSA